MENIIKEISIENIKGISKKNIKFVSFYPNKLTILVGKNGTGKSTLAKSLDYLNKEKLDLAKNDTFKNLGDTVSYLPKITISCDFNNESHVLVADSLKNDIKNYYSFHIFNSQIKAKTTKRNFGGFVNATSKIGFDPIDILDIESKVRVNYSAIVGKNLFGKQLSKFFNNVGWFFENYECCTVYNECFSKLVSLVTVKKYVESLLNDLNNECTSLTVDKAKIKIQNFGSYKKLVSESHFAKSYNFLLAKHKYNDSVECVMDVLQIMKYPVVKEQITGFIKYNENQKEINQIKKDFEFINTCGRDVIFECDKKLKLILPDDENISNGERDLLTLFALYLSNIRKTFKTIQNVFVFDEIFDYFDGANMLIFQFIINKIIEYAKTNNKKIYLLVLTHLDPNHFNSFITHKDTHVEFFDDLIDVFTNQVLKDYLISRDRSNIKDDVDKHYFHYFPKLKVLNKNDCKQKFESDFAGKYKNSNEFYDELKINKNNYLNNKKYDISELCFWLRIKCEFLLYNLLDTAEQKENFLIERSRNKIKYVENLHYEIPDIIYLMSFFFNEGAHLSESGDQSKMNLLYLKTSTKAFKRLVSILDKEQNL